MGASDVRRRHLDVALGAGRQRHLGAASCQAFPADFDPGTLFDRLPEGRCQCPHWGIVLTGELVVHYADRVEKYEAGDAYYIEPGHVPLPRTGTEVVEFSPTDALRVTNRAIEAVLAAQEPTIDLVGTDLAPDEARP